ncbi:MAG: hypothetical protein ACOY33_04560 [Pseudomonadota bacterium]
MTPFLIATLLALFIVGGLGAVYRRGDRRRFRQALGGSIAVVVLAAVYAVWISGGERTRIEAAQVALADLRLVEVAGSFRLEGRIQNRSATHTITSVPVRLRVEDCAGDNCRTVHDETADVLLSVPPGGTAGFHRVYAATAGQPQGTRRWEAEAGAPRAFEAESR